MPSLLKEGDCLLGLSQPRMVGPQSHKFQQFHRPHHAALALRANPENDDFRRQHPTERLWLSARIQHDARKRPHGMARVAAWCR